MSGETQVGPDNPVATTRSFFEEWLGGGDPSQFSTKELWFFCELGNAAGANAGETYLDREYRIERVELKRNDERAAEVDIDAWLRSTTALVDGSQATNEWMITGPVIVRKGSDGWRVADFFHNGHPFVRGSFRAAGEGLDVNGVALTPLAVMRRNTATLFYFQIRNQTQEPAVIWAVKTCERLRLLGPWGQHEAFVPAVELESGDDATSAAIFDPKVPIREAMKLEVTGRANGEIFSADWRVRLRRARLNES